MKINKFGDAFLIIWVILCLLIAWLMHSTPKYIQTVINLDDPFLCNKNGEKWSQAEITDVNEDLNICTTVKSNDQELRAQIQIRVYEGERAGFELPVYYNNSWITNGNISILFPAYLHPGDYTVDISSGRKQLSTFLITIQNQ